VEDDRGEKVVGEKRKEVKLNHLRREAVRLFRQSEQFVQALFTPLIKEVKVNPKPQNPSFPW
jgi:hypothetical protein